MIGTTDSDSVSLPNAMKGRNLGKSKQRDLKRSPRKLSDSQWAFDDAAGFIRDGFSQRQTVKGLRPFDSANGYLRREAYALIRETKSRKGGANTIKSLVQRLSTTPESPEYAENPFYWGLLAIDPHRDFLSAQDLSRFAKQLLYADRNGVPPSYLIGFLYQTGGPRDLSHKLVSKVRDDSLALDIQR